MKFTQDGVKDSESEGNVVNDSKSIREIFFEVSELNSPAERERRLDEVCRDDKAKREKLETLLNAYDNPDSRFEESPVKSEITGHAPNGPMPAIEEVGDTIGSYKLLQLLGEGGFGMVYMAEQATPVERMVALKIVKPGMDTREVVARFESERQALALMDHPNIAHVLDAGQTETGRPYFVMELVRGVPITEFADKNHMTTKERLELFDSVCRAVQHAHHKGIIHRDLKPSNVMVTLHDGGAVVKVIDFGVAKALSKKLTEKTLFTAYGQMVGTPQYMSPEQAEMSGLDVDTRTDVFALGVLLYELLIGTTPIEPQRLREAGFAEIQRIIREEDAPRLSGRLSSMGDKSTIVAKHRSVDAQRLQQIVQGDLDLIVMKCLEKDRNRRYDSANGLADDIQRHLRNEPVVAHAPSFTYRFGKAWRRNRTLYVAALAVLGSLILGTIVSIWQANTAILARQEAQANLSTAQAAAAEASEARDQAGIEKARAIRTAQDLRRQLYVRDIGLAFATIREGNLPRAQDILGKYFPDPKQPHLEDLRGFEWRHLWDQSQRIDATNLGPFNGFISAAALSPDGQLLAIRRSTPNRVDIVNVESGALAKTIPTEEPANPLMFSPNGRLLLARSRTNDNQIINGWDTSTWQRRKPLVLTTPFTVGQRKDQPILVACNPDQQSFSVWNIETWEKIGDLSNRPDNGKLLAAGYGLDWHMIDVLATSHDDGYLYLSSAAGIRRWDLRNLKELEPIRDGLPNSSFGTGLSCLATSGDGQLAAGDRWGNVHLFDAEQGKLTHTFDSHLGWVACLEFAQAGTRLISGGADRNAVIYDPHAKTIVRRLLGQRGQVWATDITADGKVAISASAGDRVLKWSLAETEDPAQLISRSLGHTILEDGRIACLIGQSPDDVTVYDPVKHTLQPLGYSELVKAYTERGARPIRSSANGRWLATVDDAATIVWNVSGDKLLELTPSPPDYFRCSTVFSPDSRFLATAPRTSNGRGDVILWNTDDWSSRVLFDGNSGLAVDGIGFSSDSNRVAVAQDGGPIRVFDVGQEHEPRLVREFAIKSFVVGLSRRGQWLATSQSAGNTITVFDVATGDTLAVLEGHINTSFSLSFSPDDRTLVSCSHATIKLWNTATWQEMMSIPADGVPTNFSPDGSYLATHLQTAPGGYLGDATGLYLLRAPPMEEIDRRFSATR